VGSARHAIGLLAASEEHSGHLVPLLRRLSADLEVFDAVIALRVEDGALRAVVMPDGTEVPRDVLFVGPPRPNRATPPSPTYQSNGRDQTCW
jgi:hypothetical protein